MPRPKRGTNTPNALISSAARIVSRRRKNLPAGTSAWQEEVWTMLDSVGELEFYREWMANALSRCTLTVEEQQDDGTWKPTTDPTALAALQILFDGADGQAEMLDSMAGHLCLPGETWLCGLTTPSEDPDIDTWRVLSHAEVKQEGQGWTIDRGDGAAEKYTDDEVYMARIWSPHPKKHVEAHSSVRSALPILRELVGLSQHVGASIDSRLAGAGVLFVPQELTFTTPQEQNDDGTEPEGDPFMHALTTAMITAIEDRGDASALTPIVARVPAQFLDKIKHVTFSTPFQAETMELRKEAIQRLANSLNIPAEVLLGMADVNHWTGWLLDENAIKMHVEPLLGVITGGLTTRYLWPMLQGDAERMDAGIRRFRIKGHTDALRQRPNRSAEAQAMHGTMTITDEALVRETGMEAADLLDPGSPEWKRRMLVKVATTAPPETAALALAALGLALTLPDPEADPEGPAALPAAPPTPPAAPENVRDIPTQEAAALRAAALLAVSEQAVGRAVERAWNKSGKRGRVRGPVDAASLDALLSDAWGYAPRAAALCSVDEDRLRHTWDQYTRTILVTGADHDPRGLASALVANVLSSHAEAIEG